LGNNDLSDAAQARGEIFWVPVYSPDDITANGPRGFDPAHPTAWVARAKAEHLGIGTAENPAPSPTKHGLR
jgi:hypothetical protein